jgi:hypothetical protein
MFSRGMSGRFSISLQTHFVTTSSSSGNVTTNHTQEVRCPIFLFHNGNEKHKPTRNICGSWRACCHLAILLSKDWDGTGMGSRCICNERAPRGNGRRIVGIRRQFLRGGFPFQNMKRTFAILGPRFEVVTIGRSLFFSCDGEVYGMSPPVKLDYELGEREYHVRILW